MIFEIKIVANDMKSATTWSRIRESNYSPAKNGVKLGAKCKAVLGERVEFRTIKYKCVQRCAFG